MIEPPRDAAGHFAGCYTSSCEATKCGATARKLPAFVPFAPSDEAPPRAKHPTPDQILARRLNVLRSDVAAIEDCPDECGRAHELARDVLRILDEPFGEFEDMDAMRAALMQAREDNAKIRRTKDEALIEVRRAQEAAATALEHGRILWVSTSDKFAAGQHVAAALQKALAILVPPVATIDLGRMLGRAQAQGQEVRTVDGSGFRTEPIPARTVDGEWTDSCPIDEKTLTVWESATERCSLLAGVAWLIRRELAR